MDGAGYRRLFETEGGTEPGSFLELRERDGMNGFLEGYLSYLAIGAGVILTLLSVGIAYLVIVIRFAWPHLLSRDE